MQVPSNLPIEAYNFPPIFVVEQGSQPLSTEEKINHIRSTLESANAEFCNVVLKKELHKNTNDQEKTIRSISQINNTIGAKQKRVSEIVSKTVKDAFIWITVSTGLILTTFTLPPLAAIAVVTVYTYTFSILKIIPSLKKIRNAKSSLVLSKLQLNILNSKKKELEENKLKITSDSIKEKANKLFFEKLNTELNDMNTEVTDKKQEANGQLNGPTTRAQKRNLDASIIDFNKDLKLIEQFRSELREKYSISA